VVRLSVQCSNQSGQLGKDTTLASAFPSLVALSLRTEAKGKQGVKEEEEAMYSRVLATRKRVKITGGFSRPKSYNK
jgi:hypothetical protein